MQLLCGTQQGLEDPFKGRTAAARIARDGYLHMWDVLVREAASSELLFDSYLLEKLTNLVIALNWCADSVHGRVGACKASSIFCKPLYAILCVIDARCRGHSMQRALATTV